METRGTVYIVAARRADGGWIQFRTCDRVEATSVARRLGARVVADGGEVRISRVRRPGRG